jgi:hypothetical protein
MTRTSDALMARHIAGLSVSLVAVVGIAGCADDAGDQQARGSGPSAGVTSSSSNAAGPDQTYVGPNNRTFSTWSAAHEESQVTVIGSVESVLNEHAFTVAGEGGSADLLIVGRGKVTNLAAGDRVAVTGAVHRAFNRTEIESKVNADFDDAAFQDLEGDPYVQASNTALE